MRIFQVDPLVKKQGPIHQNLFPVPLEEVLVNLGELMCGDFTMNKK